MLGGLGIIARLRLPIPIRARISFVFFAAFLYVTTLVAAWPVLTAEDYLPFFPAMALTVAPALLWLSPGVPHHYAPDPDTGWDEGFVDFAGCTQVHSIGGWAALMGVYILGPRIGKYGPDGKVNAIPDEMEEATDYAQQALSARELEASDFLGRKGDVFIWHEQLYHGGREILDPSLNGVGGALVQAFCTAGALDPSGTCTDTTTPVAEAVSRSDGYFQLMLPDPGVAGVGP